MFPPHKDGGQLNGEHMARGEDGIDTTEHLKLKQIEAYVQQRPDRRSFEWNHERILQTFPQPIDRLAAPKSEGGLAILDEYQRYSAVEITLLHDIALDKLGIATQREFSHWFDWGEGPKHPETVYMRVMRGLLRRHSHLVERICFQKVVEQDYLWMEKQSHNIQAAFDALGEALSAEKARIRREVEEETGRSFDEVCKTRYETHLMRQRLDK